MINSTQPVDIQMLLTELAVLKRENELLHKWLEDQKQHAAELRQIILNRGDAK